MVERRFDSEVRSYPQDSTGALQGVHIVSLAQNLPGPMVLARLISEGASALKVEPPSGDPFSSLSPAWYADLHEGVEVERLDLKTESHRRKLGQHLAGADLLLTSHRPSVLARLGLGPDEISASQPHLRHLNIVGDCSRPEIPGHDVTYQAGAGLVEQSLPTTLLADLMGAECAFAAALLLLRGPPGSRLQVGLADSLEFLVAPLRYGLTSPGGVLGGGIPAYGLYAAREGRVAVAALEPHFRARLYEALGLPLDHPLAETMRLRTAQEWEVWAQERDLPMEVVRDFRSPEMG